MFNLKLKKSLAKENYSNQLVIKGSCQVKEIVDYEKHKFDSQLIQETEINEGKYSKNMKILISLKSYRIFSFLFLVI